MAISEMVFNFFQARAKHLKCGLRKSRLHGLTFDTNIQYNVVTGGTEPECGSVPGSGQTSTVCGRCIRVKCSVCWIVYWKISKISLFSPILDRDWKFYCQSVSCKWTQFTKVFLKLSQFYYLLLFSFPPLLPLNRLLNNILLILLLISFLTLDDVCRINGRNMKLGQLRFFLNLCQLLRDKYENLLESSTTVAIVENLSVIFVDRLLRFSCLLSFSRLMSLVFVVEFPLLTFTIFWWRWRRWWRLKILKVRMISDRITSHNIHLQKLSKMVPIVVDVLLEVDL